MEDFTPLSAALGGVLIGFSAGLLWLANGQIAGVSGILGGIVPARVREIPWRLAFLVALSIGGLAGYALLPVLFPHIPHELPSIDGGLAIAVIGGLLVGIGTRLSGGCTSGHGVCGLARLSPRSFVAVAVFMATASVTVIATRYVL